MLCCIEEGLQVQIVVDDDVVIIVRKNDPILIPISSVFFDIRDFFTPDVDLDESYLIPEFPIHFDQRFFIYGIGHEWGRRKHYLMDARPVMIAAEIGISEH